MSSIKIGTYEDKGVIFTTHKSIETKETVQSGVSYDQALSTAKSHAGAELIVSRNGAFDVIALSIDGLFGKAKDKRIAGAGNLVKFNDNVPGLLSAPDAFVVDENNGIQVMMPGNENNDAGKGRHVIAHAHNRELAGARQLANSIGNAGMRATLTGLLDQLLSAKSNLQQNESSLNTQLRNANQALAGKRIPYDQAIAAANENYRSLEQRHAGIVAQKGEDLREAQRPGIHQAEDDLRRRQGELGDAQGRLDEANDALRAANNKFDRADRLAEELNVKRGDLRSVNKKYGDYLRGNEYLNKHNKFPNDWKTWQGSDGQTYGQPLSWGPLDSWYSVQTTKQNLDADVRSLEVSVPSLQNQAQRDKEDAQGALQTAQQNLGYTQGRADAAQYALGNLREGNPSSIDRAQQALDDAKQAQTNALGSAQARINKGQSELEVNTRTERKTVEELKLQLKNAPNAFHQAIDETSKKLGL